uniref:cation diffusion facilitator family transporter n=1 Tax=Ornithobacterium rhinotracheale TaxID=28251 RepID=UPI0039A47712
MEHHHHHHHHHEFDPKQVNRAFIIGIVLNLAYLLLEFGFGFYLNSTSLISDAIHNLADVSTLFLSLIGFKLLAKKSVKNYTYGYRKSSILIALFNAILLLISMGAVILEAVQRFSHPTPLPGKTIAIIAGIGVVINAFTGWLFMKDQHKDINIKGAYLHLMSDALVSVAVLLGGLLMLSFGWFWVDPVLSIGIALVVIYGTWHLLRDSLRMSLDGVPPNVSLEKVEDALNGFVEVSRVEHIHIWAISSVENAMTAHIYLNQALSCECERDLKDDMRHAMLHLHIHHCTFEIEHKEKED